MARLAIENLGALAGATEAELNGNEAHDARPTEIAQGATDRAGALGRWIDGVLLDRRLSPQSTRVALLIARLTVRTGGLALPSLRDIGRRLGFSDDSASCAIADLRSDGHINVRSEPGKPTELQPMLPRAEGGAA